MAIERYYAEGRLVADKRGGLVSYADLAILEAQINTLQKLNNGASEEVRSSRGRIGELEAEIARLRANNMGVKYDPHPPSEAMKPAVIHVVTPESSSGKLWAEVQRLQAVEAESARTIAHLNQTHREISEMQQARIAKLEEVLDKIADHRTQLPWSECHRIAHAALGPANLQETDIRQVLYEVRQLKEEISTITHEFKKASVCGVGMGPLQGRALVWSRILARLQSLLAAKSAGMKPEAL